MWHVFWSLYYLLIFFICFFRYLYDLHNRTKFNKHAFFIYFLHQVFNIIVNLKLQSAIDVNYFRPNSNSRKRLIVLSMFSFFSFGIKSFSLPIYATSENFLPINNFVSYYKKTGNRRMIVVKELTRNNIYELFISILFL